MPFIRDAAFDAGLNNIRDDVGALYICSQEPTTYTEATATYDLGSKTSPTVGSVENGASSGRRIITSAITDGSVSDTGTATHWALVKTTATTDLLATGTLSSSQSVTSGNTFTLTAFSITFPDAVAE
tara:strand:+ start:589 stop:969 length:381 start_codon:yes stop_codon:yes gene_type:complete